MYIAVMLVAGGSALLALPSRAQEAPQTITFDEAVHIALEQNTQLKRASNNVQLQGINVTRNWMDFFPELSFSSSGQQSFGRSFIESEGRIISETNRFLGLDVGSSINLFNGFEKVASLEQAQFESAASTQVLERTRQDVVFQVMAGFITVLENEELISVREEELDYQQQLLEQIEAFVEVGARPTSELYQQQAAVAEAELALLEAEQLYQLSQTELIQVLQLDPFGEYVFEAPAVEEAALAPAAYDLEQLLQTALAQRADLDAGQFNVAAAEQGVRMARSGYFPSLSLSGGYGSNWTSTAFQEMPNGGPQRVPFFEQLDRRRSGFIGLSLSVPIFDRLQTRNNTAQAQVALQNARYDLEDLRQEVALEVRQAYLNYEAAEKALGVTATRLQAAEQAREAAEARYNLGAAPFVELAQANAEYASAASARVQARYDFVYRRKLIDYFLGMLDPAAPLFE